MAAVRIRKAAGRDEAWIRALIPRLHAFGPPGYRAERMMNDAEAAATVAALAGGGDRIVLAAEDDHGAPLGFVHLETAVDFFTRERHGHISTIVVSPAAERQGVGRALLDAAQAWCAGKRYRLLTLNVFEHNDAARRLYEQSGFRIDTIRYLKLVKPDTTE